MTALLSLTFYAERRAIFLPGLTSDGHVGIEQSCNSCHVAFAGVPNKNCADCHEAEIREDTHPVKLFDNPRWADMLRKVNALQCVNCHGEHKTARRGVTVSQEFCYPCHDDVTMKRPSHRDLEPTSCWAGGCHNYHDNTALNIAFLKKRMDVHAPLPGVVLDRSTPQGDELPATADAPDSQLRDSALVRAWQESFHARRDVNCSDCHGSEAKLNPAPADGACARCHGYEIDTFKRGKHGGRAAVKLAPLTSREARRPMKTRTASNALSCTRCHDAHATDTRKAAVEACLGCHDDTHSKSFTGSKHGQRFALEARSVPSEVAVTCATCHMPRTKVGDPKTGRVAVNHNNSWTLVPRDRMVKEVCLACHGLEFSVNSIFDESLIRNNFSGLPSIKHKTLEMVRQELADKTDTGVSGK